MRSGVLILGLLTLGVAALGVSQAGTRTLRPPAAVEATGRLAFHEEFSGRRLDRRRWNRCHWWARRGCTIASNNELEWYLPRQVRVRGGRVRLVAEQRSVRGSDGETYPYRSGMISSGPPFDSSRPRFSFRYGRAEIRARIPVGRGLWSAFWLLPVTRESKPEIDVMEVLGHRPRTVEMHLHYRDGEEVRQRGHEWRHLSPGWHTFGIDWRPGRLAWLVDGKVRWRVRGEAVPSERMYLVANLAVGGDWPGPPDSATRFPSSFDIDWVKVRR